MIMCSVILNAGINISALQIVLSRNINKLHNIIFAVHFHWFDSAVIKACISLFRLRVMLLHGIIHGLP